MPRKCPIFRPLSALSHLSASALAPSRAELGHTSALKLPARLSSDLCSSSFLLCSTLPYLCNTTEYFNSNRLDSLGRTLSLSL